MSTRLGPEHHLFTQTIAARRLVSEAEATQLLTKCLTLTEKQNSTNLKEHTQRINAHLSQLFLEIRWGTCEVDGTKYLAFVNNKEDEHSKLCSNHPAVAFGFFKKILDEVIMSDDGQINNTDCLTLSNNLPDQKKLTYTAARELLTQWSADKWLIDNKTNNSYQLGPRAIIELGQYISTAYGSHIANCMLCQQLCISGQRCDECNSKFHGHCLQRLINRTKEGHDNRCPKCSTEWN